MKLNQDLEQKQLLSARMLQSIEILQMNTSELENFLEKLSLENPVIDLPDPDRSKAIGNDLNDEEQRRLEWLENTDRQNKDYYRQDRIFESVPENTGTGGERETLEEHLLSQIDPGNYTGEELKIIEFIIDALDENGYFTEDISEAAGFLCVSEDEFARMLEEVQKLDPKGVAAKDLKDCLLLQLPAQDRGSAAGAIIKDYLPDVAKSHLSRISSKLGISPESTRLAVEQIKKLDPRPAGLFGSEPQTTHVIPEALVIKNEDGSFKILMSERKGFEFSVNEYYVKMLKETEDAETKKYLQEKIAQAKFVKKCIAERSSTVIRVMDLVVELQSDFFENGPGHKKPMRLSDIADRLGIHPSTVSRAMKGKYLQCFWGIYPFDYFLTGALPAASGAKEGKTPEQIKALIKQITDSENKEDPLSDLAISEKLEEYDVKISRRTVNKYRTEAGIPDKAGRRI